VNIGNISCVACFFIGRTLEQQKIIAHGKKRSSSAMAAFEFEYIIE